jgi:hypothetical protein
LVRELIISIVVNVLGHIGIENVLRPYPICMRPNFAFITILLVPRLTICGRCEASIALAFRNVIITDASQETISEVRISGRLIVWKDR